MTKSKWSLTVRLIYLVDCQVLLTPMLSDGKQARVVARDVSNKVEDVGVKVEDVGDKVEDIDDKVRRVDEKVQVAIDGARVLSSRTLSPSNIYTFRRQASQSSGTGNKIGPSTGGQRHRRNQVFVNS
jgi:uncharacterized protein YoxC